MKDYRPLALALLSLPPTATDAEIEYAALNFAARQGQPQMGVTLSAVGLLRGSTPPAPVRRMDLVMMGAEHPGDGSPPPDAAEDDAAEKIRKQLGLTREQWDRID